MLRRLVHWLQPIFLTLAIIAITWYLTSQWPTLRTYPWRIHWGWLTTALLLSLASWAVEIAIWQQLLAKLGGKLRFWAASRIWFLSAIVRYIPGTIWQPLSITFYTRRHGVTPETALTSILLYQVIITLASAPFLVAYFLWLDTKSLATEFAATLPSVVIWCVLLPIVAFLLRPQWLIHILNWLLVRIKRPPIAARLTSLTLLTLLFVALLDWFLWGSLFAAFTFAFAGEGIGTTVAEKVAIAPLLIASYPIANITGLLTMISPSGFGIREGAFYLLLTPQIDGSVVTVIALGIRVWSIIGELLLAFISYFFEQADQKNDRKNIARTNPDAQSKETAQTISDRTLLETSVITPPDLHSGNIRNNMRSEIH